ncbi:MAG: hypothetical protein M4579_007467, partial [Chaenotheca gracillima]
RSKLSSIASQKRRSKCLRIGVPLEYNIDELSPEVKNCWVRTLRHLQAQGHTVHQVSLPSTKHALSAYYVLAPAEASSNLAKYDGIRYGTRTENADDDGDVLFAKTRGAGFGPEVKRRILLGAYSLSAEAMDNYFIQAQKVRRRVQQDFDKVFALPNPLVAPPKGLNPREHDVDVLICPTAPTLPPRLDDLTEQSPLDAYMNDVLTVPASLAGLPAISLPVSVEESEKERSGGSDSVGMQIIAQYGDEETLFRAAALIEEWSPPRKRSDYSD